MIVFFISECEKKARKRTAEILDSFAERIGSSTWKTRITMEGLKSIKLLLSKSATRNTSVTCHRIAGNNNTKLMWIIGNRRRFDSLGRYSTGLTKKNLIGAIDNDWLHLELIKVIAALAALFHDFGKAWDAFQDVLRSNGQSDHLRHEYVSLLLWISFVQGRSPAEWLEDLSDPGSINEDSIIHYACSLDPYQALFDFLPDHFSRIIGWLIVGHHLQPEFEKNASLSCTDLAGLLRSIRPGNGYIKKSSDQSELTFSNGLPLSPAWAKQAARWAIRGKRQIQFLKDDQDAWEGLLRPVAHFARTALMIGDHEASKEEQDNKKKPPKSCCNGSHSLWAKSCGTDPDCPTFLDEHLLDVTRKTLSFCHVFPYLEQNLACAEQIEAIEIRSPDQFAWQDQAARHVREVTKKTGNPLQGFFGLNMAGTGTGKTFGNAKIMHAVQSGRVRYTLALGLRTLTLQTGDEYRERIGLDQTELAVVIGSRAVRELYETPETSQADESNQWDIFSGWEDIEFSNPVLDEQLASKISNRKTREILYSPVLVCTIDHIMGATEGTRRGRHLIPWLRMLSSDLVIDEMDDFDGDNLVAILRLVHLAGMLGRNVMLSSATIPPAVAESSFESYLSGWRLFANSRNKDQKVLAAWFDETSGARSRYIHSVSEFRNLHDNYIKSRIKKLRDQPTRRKADVLSVEPNTFASEVLDAAIKLHHHHGMDYAGKMISFGAIRLAHISPCVAMSRYLLQANLPKDTEIKIMPYHSRFPRISRHFIEKTLDSVLSRKNPCKSFEHETVKRHLNTDRKHILFIVVATPIEELGRDHDFDWAVLEPSSIRSLIQMSGRVLRHRQINEIHKPNVIVLSRNVYALRGKTVAYTRPGYESSRLKLPSHNLLDIIDVNGLQDRVDASWRLARPLGLEPANDFRSLEHCSLDNLLTQGEANDYSTVQGWNDGPWHLAHIAQKARPFRGENKDISFYLLPRELDDALQFHLKNDAGGMVPWDSWVSYEELTLPERNRLWQPDRYIDQLEEIGRVKDIDLEAAARRYGEIAVPYKWQQNTTDGVIRYNAFLGLWEERNIGEMFAG